MSLQSIPLRKLLLLLYAETPLRTSKLREDIRNEIARERGERTGGPDFHSPFWRSAKDHVFGNDDLHDAVERHIAANFRRTNLYPRLRDGFLLWWNERRRWTNQPFRERETIKGQKLFRPLDAIIKVDSVLAVQDGIGEDHFIYPYFSAEPRLSDEAARIGLHILCETFPKTPAEEIRLLDVIRGRNFSLETTPLQGNEEEVLTGRFRRLVSEWERLRDEYD